MKEIRNILLFLLACLIAFSCEKADNEEPRSDGNIYEGNLKICPPTHIDVGFLPFEKFYRDYIANMALVVDSLVVSTFIDNQGTGLYYEADYNKNTKVFNERVKCLLQDNRPWIFPDFKSHLNDVDIHQHLAGEYDIVSVYRGMNSRCTMSIDGVFLADDNTLVAECGHINEKVFLFKSDIFSAIEYNTPIIGRWNGNGKLYCFATNRVLAEKHGDYFVLFWNGKKSDYFDVLKKTFSGNQFEYRDHFTLIGNNGERIKLYLDEIEYGDYNYLNSIPNKESHDGITLIKYNKTKL